MLLERVLLTPVASCCLVSCATMAAPIQTRVSVTYQAPEATGISRLAILPVTAGPDLEGFRRLAGDALYDAIIEMWAGEHVLSAEGTNRELNRADLADAYSDMLFTHERTGILDQATLVTIGRTLGVSHLIHVRMLDAGEQMATLLVRIWSPEVGDVVWEGHGRAVVEVGSRLKDRSLPEVLFETARAVAREIRPLLSQ